MYDIIFLPLAFAISTVALWWKFRKPELFVAAIGSLLYVSLTMYQYFTPYEDGELVKAEGTENTWRQLPSPKEHRRAVQMARVSTFAAWVMTLGVLTFAIRVRPEEGQESG